LIAVSGHFQVHPPP